MCGLTVRLVLCWCVHGVVGKGHPGVARPLPVWLLPWQPAPEVISIGCMYSSKQGRKRRKLRSEDIRFALFFFPKSAAL